MGNDNTGGLTTHVLDTMHGTPAEGLKIQLHKIDGDSKTLIKDVKTNADGRVDAPLLKNETFATGVYELSFYVADYYRAKGVSLPEPAFIDVVPLRFGIADAHSHYHVPLLVSPFSYSTYRGS